MTSRTTANSLSNSDMESVTNHGRSGPNEIVSDVEKDSVQQAQKTESTELAWDGPDDPDNPMNWPKWRRRMQIVCVALMTLLANLVTTMFAPGIQQLGREFGIASGTVLSMTVSIYLLGFALGPLVLAPLSELHGRLIIYAASSVVFLALTVGCAFATDAGMFIAFRFLAGCAGSAPSALCGGTLADVIEREHRGRWVALFVLGPLLGPVAGPIAGGFITQDLGWRWVFRVVLIAACPVVVLCVALLRETYAPVILRRRTARRAQAAGLDNASHPLPSADVPAKSQLLTRSILRPLRLLFLSPIVLFLSLYVAFAFGLMFLLFTTFSAVFIQQYGWSTGISGSSYLGLGGGMLAAVLAQATLGEAIVRRRASRNGGHSKPEDRLSMMAWMAPLLPAGMLWYGWSVYKQTHWIVPILGTSLVGMGNVFVMMPPMIYLVDVFGPEAGASALAANAVLRSVGGAFLPLAGPAMYQKMGLGWGNSLLGFLAVAFIPIPWVLLVYGERIRLSRKSSI